MARQLLQDSIMLTPQLTESVKELPDGRLCVIGKFQHCDVVNRNNRIYPRNVWEKHCRSDSEFNKALRERGVCGHLEHPSSGKPDLNMAAIVVTNVELREDGEVWGTMETLSNPVGVKAKSFFKDGLSVGISSRAHGSVKRNVNGIDEVQEDFAPESFDLVSEPSTPGAYLHESLIKELEEMGEEAALAEVAKSKFSVRADALLNEALESVTWDHLWEARLNDLKFFAKQFKDEASERTLRLIQETLTVKKKLYGSYIRTTSRANFQRATAFTPQDAAVTLSDIDIPIAFSQRDFDKNIFNSFINKGKLFNLMDYRGRAVMLLVDEKDISGKVYSGSLSPSQIEAARKLGIKNPVIVLAKISNVSQGTNMTEGSSTLGEKERRYRMGRLQEQADEAAKEAKDTVKKVEKAASDAASEVSGTDKEPAVADVAVAKAKAAAGEAEAAAQAAKEASTEEGAKVAAEQAAVAAEKAVAAAAEVEIAVEMPGEAVGEMADESPVTASKTCYTVECTINFEGLPDAIKKKINAFRPGEDLTALRTLVEGDLESVGITIKSLDLYWEEAKIMVKAEIDGNPEKAKACIDRVVTVAGDGSKELDKPVEPMPEAYWGSQYYGASIGTVPGVLGLFKYAKEHFKSGPFMEAVLSLESQFSEDLSYVDSLPSDARGREHARLVSEYNAKLEALQRQYGIPPVTESYKGGDSMGGIATSLAHKQYLKDMREEKKVLRERINKLENENASLRILNQEMVILFEGEVIRFETAALIKKHPELTRMKTVLEKNRTMPSLHEMAADFRKAFAERNAEPRINESPRRFSPRKETKTTPRGSVSSRNVDAPSTLNEDFTPTVPSVPDGTTRTEPTSISRLVRHRERKARR